jgi:RNA polymerase sigma factor (sigma-70 family)
MKTIRTNRRFNPDTELDRHNRADAVMSAYYKRMREYTPEAWRNADVDYAETVDLVRRILAGDFEQISEPVSEQVSEEEREARRRAEQEYEDRQARQEREDAPERARRQSLAYASPLPPTPAPAPKLKKQRVKVYGQSTARDITITAMLLDAEEKRAVIDLQGSLGMEVDPEEAEQAEVEESLVREDLQRMGYSRGNVDAAQIRLWNEISFDAQKAMRKLGSGRQDVNADEVAHEAAVRAYLNVNKFEGESQLSTWVFSITRSVLCDFLSRGKVGGGVGSGGLGLGIRGAPKGSLAGREDIYRPVGGEEGIGEEIGSSALDYRYLSSEERAEQEAEAQALALEELNLGGARIQKKKMQREQQREQREQRGQEQDAIITEVFSQLSPDHQQLLQLCTVRGSHRLPDGSMIETHGRLSQARMAAILNIPQQTLQSRLARARKRLIDLSGGRLHPPFTGVLSEAYFNTSTQGKEAVVGPTGQVEVINRFVLPTGERSTTVRRQPRANPYVSGTEFYYETPYDLLDLWLDKVITQEQYNVCMADLEAELGYAVGM